MSRILSALIIALMSMPTSAKSIVVLGDSISAGYGIEVSQGWVALLRNQLQTHNPPYSVHNESISGDTTAGGLARINPALQRHHPEIVIIELGANDGLRGLAPTLIKSNLAELVSRAQKAGAKVLLLSMRIPPNYGKRYTDMFYDIYPSLAKDLKIAYVPFILEDVALINDLMQADGLHPNAKAQAAIVEKIWPQLKPLLQ
ncbi:MAG: arylesterase [Methylococcaceae bacterium]|nr:arylesterase [Methylococcaceae bacterium]MDZ4157697.1 arylesterase [Methylococcales bacterium]MDP2393051.1 arylesterase [Methylococcaceae bacterium]MDP3019195.1 arylesterase [Methylococcaceae bacterium]MDP3389224.1 arylesterase [Methylococcaceae bacterium]